MLAVYIFINVSGFNTPLLTNGRGGVVAGVGTASVWVDTVDVGDTPLTCCAAVHGGCDW